MARYDSGVRFDSGARFDEEEEPATPTPTRKKPMASLKLNLSRLNRTQTIALATTGVTMLAPVAGTPPVPITPPVAGIGTEVAAMATARDVAEAANDAYEAAKAALVNLKQVADDKTDLLRVKVTACADALSAKAEGNAAILSLSGWPLAAAPGGPAMVPGPISNFTVTAGDMEQTLQYHWDPEAGSKTYELQITTVDPMAGPYVTKVQKAGSSADVDGLTSGQRVWARVRGIGSDTKGPWTDPATKIVP